MTIYYDATIGADDIMIAEAIYEAARAIKQEALDEDLGWSDEFDDDLDQLDYSECEEV